MTLYKPWAPAVTVLFDSAVEPPLEGKAPAPNGTPPEPEAEPISVCLTVFNYGRYIESCLDSIHAQTYPAIELVIVDDHSDKDDSAEVAVAWARAHAARFTRVLVVSHDHNQGPAEARNTSFRCATSQWLFIIDADNELYPRALRRLYDAATEGGFDATYTQVEKFGDVRAIGQADMWDVEEVRRENYVDVMALLRRHTVEQVGGFSHIEEGWEDYDFWLKYIDKKFVPAYVPEILCRYRVHTSSRTVTQAYQAHFDLRRLMAFRHPGMGFREKDTPELEPVAAPEPEATAPAALDGAKPPKKPAPKRRK